MPKERMKVNPVVIDYELNQPFYIVKRYVYSRTEECVLCGFYGANIDLIKLTGERHVKGYLYLNGELLKCPRCDGKGEISIKSEPIWRIQPLDLTHDMLKQVDITVYELNGYIGYICKYLIGPTTFYKANGVLADDVGSRWAFPTLEEAKAFCDECNGNKAEKEDIMMNENEEEEEE